jgi:hypothetical protein
MLLPAPGKIILPGLRQNLISLEGLFWPAFELCDQNFGTIILPGLPQNLIAENKVVFY